MPIQSSKRGPILVTGAASGIGKMTTALLVEKGHLVYACDIDGPSLEIMDKEPKITSIKVDVTNTEDITRAVTRIKEDGRGLYGLVNNAGYSELGPLVEITLEELHRLFDVNVYGYHRMTNAMFPFLIESQGRIVNIGSIAGIAASKFRGIYCMTKHALEAYTDYLSSELEKFNIKVSIIEPGKVKTNIAERSRSALDRILADPESRFKDEINEFIQEMATDTPYPTPERVAEAVDDALFSESPKKRYLVASSNETAFIVKTAITRLIQLNQNHEYSYDKETLLSMVSNLFE